MATRQPKPAPTARLIGARQVTAEYGIKYTTLRDLVHRGELPLLRLGRAWYLERSDIDRWIASRKELASIR
jgi:excisionase family DNA binding protein